MDERVLRSWPDGKIIRNIPESEFLKIYRIVFEELESGEMKNKSELRSKIKNDLLAEFPDIESDELNEVFDELLCLKLIEYCDPGQSHIRFTESYLKSGEFYLFKVRPFLDQ